MKLPPEAMEPYVCDALGITPVELRELDHETVMLHLAWYDGKALGEWATAKPRLKHAQC